MAAAASAASAAAVAAPGVAADMVEYVGDGEIGAVLSLAGKS
jgi:hypothetical protein